MDIKKCEMFLCIFWSMIKIFRGMPNYWNAHAEFKKWFLMLSFQEIGSNLVSFGIIFEALPLEFSDSSFIRWVQKSIFWKVNFLKNIASTRTERCADQAMRGSLLYIVITMRDFKYPRTCCKLKYLETFDISNCPTVTVSRDLECLVLSSPFALSYSPNRSSVYKLNSTRRTLFNLNKLTF